MTDSQARLTLLAGGDVAPLLQPVDQFAELIQPTLDTVDFRFLQCERTYSHRGSWPDWQTIPAGHWTRLDPEYASVFKAARADVVSVASNHALDFGADALEDTIELFTSWGMQVVGGGANQAEAHKPVICEKDGVRVAILAYCSVIRDGQAAVGDHPGVAGLRARTWYVPIDFQPGCPPQIMSEAIEPDVVAMENDIRAAKKIAHAVVVCLHWGVRYIPKVLATYQQPVAHRAIDAGADVIIGHHPHTLKPVEVYKGKVCFYSIGNFLPLASRTPARPRTPSGTCSGTSARRAPATASRITAGRSCCPSSRSPPRAFPGSAWSRPTSTTRRSRPRSGRATRCSTRCLIGWSGCRPSPSTGSRSPGTSSLS